jgi:hypothetical protein
MRKGVNQEAVDGITGGRPRESVRMRVQFGKAVEIVHPIGHVENELPARVVVGGFVVELLIAVVNRTE